MHIKEVYELNSHPLDLIIMLEVFTSCCHCTCIIK